MPADAEYARRPLQRRPTLREVAAHAGVSPMTASRTLSDKPGVRPELRQRVLQAVEELGYHRNENARSLRPGNASGLVGIAITNLANPYYGQFALGVEEVATAHGKRILLGSTGEDPARERQLVADFLGRQVEGLIVVPAGGSADHLRPARLGSVPLVLASRMLDGVDADTAVLADVDGAYRATRELLARGHTRIAFVGHAISVFTAQRRFTGFERAMAEAGLSVDPNLVRHGTQDPSSAQAAVASLLDMADPPTAIFAANNRNAIGVLMALHTRIRDGQLAESQVPSVASFDDIELAELLPFPLLLVRHDARELGRRAATMLFERLEHPDRFTGPRLVEVPVQIQLTGSS